MAASLASALRLGVATALLASLGACAGGDRIPSSRALTPSDAYVRGLKKATRSVEHLEDLDVHTHANATLLTPDFRELFEAEYAEVYGPGRKASNLAQSNLTVLLALSTNERDLNDLTSFGRLWSVTFADGATTAAATRIEAFDRDALYLRYFFPFWNPWQRVYRMEFPLAASTTTGTLELQGLAGKIRLRW